MNMKIFIAVVIALCHGQVLMVHYCTPQESLYDCQIRLPQNERLDGLCSRHRQESIVREREYWTLTASKDPDDPNPYDKLLPPMLNQSVGSIARKILFDGEEMDWYHFSNMGRKAILKAKKELEKLGFLNHTLTSYMGYKEEYQYMKKSLKPLPSEYYGLPVDYPQFTDIVSNDLWQEDKYFTQRRLAGTCPFLLRRVKDCPHTQGMMNAEILLEHLNQNFNWDEEITRVAKEHLTLSQALREDRLFVLYHEDYHKIPQMVDILDTDLTDSHKYIESVSPIILFILNKQNDLEVVAIQKHNTPNSTVFSSNHNNNPKLKTQWLLAKGLVEVVDMFNCQFIHHLFETHMTQLIFCVVFKRHLSSRHPLYEIMQAHCLGTAHASATGMPLLTDEYSYSHYLFNIGHRGARKLINIRYKQQHYDDIDFRMILKKRGLDDITQFQDYPYRNDGRIIWDEIETFAREFVHIYYGNDEDIQEDWELQGFVNEISADGNESNGGKYKGFPNKFTTRKDLITFLNRFIWVTVQHAACNYPLIPYGAYVPIAPTKLYYDPRKEAEINYAYNLPNAAHTLMQSFLLVSLAGIRVNRLFDYSKRITDERAQVLVQKTYSRLNTCVQTILEARNQQRFERGDLTYQYLEPKWLTNSIHA